MTNSDYDFIVLGAGSGGVRAARLVAAKGYKTLVIEGRHWGGTCVNLGCVPKKYLVYASDYARALANCGDYGFETSNSQLNWDKLRDKIAGKLLGLQGFYQERLTKAGADMLTGTGWFIGPQTLAVRLSDSGEIKEYTAPKILIATGSSPYRPQLPGAELGWISDDIFSMPKLPASIIIQGGGYIALEFACILAGLGVKVTLLNRSAVFLRQFEQEVVEFALEGFAKHPNLTIKPHCSLTKLVQQPAGKILATINTQSAANGDTTNTAETQTEELLSEQVLFAMGRTPNTAELQLDKVAEGLTSPEGALIVDEFYSTKQPGLYSLGDAVGHLALTPTALAEARVLVAKHFSQDDPAAAAGVVPLDYTAIPKAVFSRPELAALGLTEEQARKQHKVKTATKIFTSQLESLREVRQKFMLKVIYDAQDTRILGIHLAGENAAEIIQGFGCAYKAKFTEELLRQVSGIHPSNAEELFTL